MLIDLQTYPKLSTLSLRRECRMAPLRVLHVDDEADIRLLVKLSLELDPDLVTRSYGTGSEALAAAADWRPDLVLLDLIMPDMGGVGTLARLRVHLSSRIPVVFMTGARRAHEPQYFRSLGAAGVIFKPFVPTALAASVRDFLRR